MSNEMVRCRRKAFGEASKEAAATHSKLNVRMPDVEAPHFIVQLPVLSSLARGPYN